MKRTFFILLLIATFLTSCSVNNKIRIYPGDVEVNRYTEPEGVIHIPRFSKEEILEIAKVTVEQNVKVCEWANKVYFSVRKDNKLYEFKIVNTDNIKEFNHARNTILYDSTWLKKDGFGRAD